MTARETALQRFRSSESVDDISRARGFVRSTVCAEREEIESAFRKVSGGRLADVKSRLQGEYDYGELRIFNAFSNR